ncbi:flagellar FlbD family protein [Lysinimonas soli]|uniref:Flagellar FlbD family protein n=1 Tax=Lysinimonas soli TaxID=1074233 RepID=A0ABW0NT11_9MICO
MIILTRLNDSQFAVNPDLVERMHSNPDTTLTLVDGTTYIVKESMDEVIDLMARFRARVISLARFRDLDEGAPASAGLLVPFPEQPLPAGSPKRGRSN